jgi:hypothetical protein
MTDVIEAIDRLKAKLDQLGNLLRATAPSGRAALKEPAVAAAIQQAFAALAEVSVKLGKAV